MNIPDPYKVLQVDSEAEDEVIEAAYRRLARKYHPDVAQGPDAQERMVRINQAWEMLRDPTRRAAVDRARSRGASTAARDVTADTQAQTTSQGYGSRQASSVHDQAANGSGSEQQGHAGATAAATGPSAEGFPGVVDPGEGDFDRRAQFVSPNWTSGRSNAGHRYDPRTMRASQGAGSAGPPPGNPQGSVLNFGRYAGWSLGEVARTDLEYLEWLDRTPIGRIYQGEIDTMLRARGRRVTAPTADRGQHGLFRRR